MLWKPGEKFATTTTKLSSQKEYILLFFFPALGESSWGVIFVRGYKLLVEEQAGEEDRINPRWPFPVLAFLGFYRVGLHPT